MLSLKSLIQYLDEYLTAGLFNDYCPNGLQIEGKEQITKIATAVSADLETIEKAIELKVDALLVHHGLFWSKDPYVITGSKRQKILQLLKNGISLIAYHLPLDAHKEVGNNWKAAIDLGWEELEPFGLFNGKTIGVKGKFKAKPVEIFRDELEAYYDHSAIQVLGGHKKVTSASLISGGAWKDISQAAKEGIDCFITGNFDEPAWYLAKEEGVNFFALGHSATEKIGVRTLGKHLQERFNLSCEYIDTLNPF